MIRSAVVMILASLTLAELAFSADVEALASRTDRAPVLRIPVQVHLGNSGRSPEEFRPILEEINEIWLTQAGICFEMRIVTASAPASEGMDLWFRPVLQDGEGMNGAFRDDHDIQVRDTPNLGPAERPARYPAARTAAHELGHGLGLRHRQDSDDNLMRSRTFGWQLSADEVRRARQAAAGKALADTTVAGCGPVQH